MIEKKEGMRRDTEGALNRGNGREKKGGYENVMNIEK